MGKNNFSDFDWAKKQEILADDLNKIIDNDDYLKDWRVGGQLRNVDPITREPIPQLPWIGQGLAIIGGYTELSPPDEFDGTNNATRFIGTVNFPDGVFHPAYTPTVVFQIGTHPAALDRVYIVVRILTALVAEFLVVKDSTNPFTSDDKYFLSYIGFGVSGGATN